MINWTDFELNAIILEEEKDFASSRSVPFGSDKNHSYVEEEVEEEADQLDGPAALPAPPPPHSDGA